MPNRPSVVVQLTPVESKVLIETEHFCLIETTVTLSKMESDIVNKANILDIDRIVPFGLGHLTLRDAQYLVGFSTSYLRELCQLGKVEALKFKGVWFIDRASLANHMIRLASMIEQQNTESELTQEQIDIAKRRRKHALESLEDEDSLVAISSKSSVKSLPTNSLVQIKILFLAANPNDTYRLRLDEEIRSIDDALRQSDYRDQFDIRQHWAVRVSDLQSYLLRYKPDIVHFSGHGSVKSEIILEDNSGHSQPVSPHALSRIFSILRDNIKCVILNACYSEHQADAIAEHIDCVIGMSKEIGDFSATVFVTAFYQALGYGRDAKTAFDLGCSLIELENLEDEQTPKLIAKRVDPQSLFLVH